MKRLYQPDCCILVVDQSEATRLAVVAALRSIGFTNIHTESSLPAALNFIRSNPVRWVITEFFANEPSNALKFLENSNERPADERYFTSIVFDKGEEDYIPKAFAAGMLSLATKPVQQDKLMAAFGTMLKTGQKYKLDSRRVAATQFRNFLDQSGQFEQLVALAEQMVESNYGSPELLLDLGYAQMKAGREKDGVATLSRARMFDRNLESAALALLKQFDDSWERLEDISLGDLGVDRVAIVDSDETIVDVVSLILQDLCVARVDIYDNGESAFEAISEGAVPDLVIQEWKIPRLSGPGFLQRLRNCGFEDIPVVILSSLVSKNDGPLLSELSISNIIQKPIQIETAKQAMVWTALAEKHPKSFRDLSRKTLQSLRQGDVFQAERYLNQIKTTPGVRDGDIAFLSGEILFASGEVEAAKVKAMESIKLLGKNSLMPLNLLAKSLLKLGDYRSALTIMNQARSISPRNIQRLLDMAELNIGLGDANAALDLVDEAKEIDPEYEQIYTSEIKASIAAKKTKRAHKLLAEMPSVSQIVSYMNNRAVALAKNGQFSEAVEMYYSTIESLPENRSAMKAIVFYNLGLCFVRNKNLEDARTSLEAVADLESDKVGEKAKSLLTRVVEAQEKGVELKIGNGWSEEQGEAYSSAEATEIFRMLQIPDAKEAPQISKIDPWCLYGTYFVAT